MNSPHILSDHRSNLMVVSNVSKCWPLFQNEISAITSAPSENTSGWIKTHPQSYLSILQIKAIRAPYVSLRASYPWCACVLALGNLSYPVSLLNASRLGKQAIDIIWIACHQPPLSTQGSCHGCGLIMQQKMNKHQRTTICYNVNPRRPENPFAYH